MPIDEVNPETAKILHYAGLFGQIMVGGIPLACPPVGAGMAVAATPGVAYNVYQRHRNNRLKTTEKGVCLVANSPVTEYLDVLTGMQGQLASFFTERNVRVNFRNGASVEDFQDALRDPTIQHIAVIGHGDGSIWKAKNGYVTEEDILAQREAERLPAKKGYFIQATCGLKGTEAFGRAAVEDSKKVLGYRSLQNITTRTANMFRPNMGLVEMCE